VNLAKSELAILGRLIRVRAVTRFVVGRGRRRRFVCVNDPDRVFLVMGFRCLFPGKREIGREGALQRGAACRCRISHLLSRSSAIRSFRWRFFALRIPLDLHCRLFSPPFRFPGSLVIAQAKTNLPLRNRWKCFHSLHLMGKAVDVLDEILNDGCGAVLASFELLSAGRDLLAEWAYTCLI